VLIFGASKGGESVYRTLQGGYNIIGFLDNNVKVQGGKLFGEIIYSPSQLTQLEFDKIIIASVYHKEIKKQLINEFHITTKNIEIFNLVEVDKATLLFGFFDYFKESIIQLLCNIPFTIAHSLFTRLLTKNDQYNYISLKKIIWLDRLETHKIKTFHLEKSSESYSPHFIGEKEKVSSIVVPDVSLYHFKKGIVMTNVNAIVFGGNEIAIGRVPNFPIGKSQYDAGFLTSHGNKNAIVKEYPQEQIEKGIAILGSNDGNYYHWIIEVLCKLQSIENIPSSFNNFPILLSEQALQIPSIKAYIKCLNISHPIIYLKSCTQYEVNSLLYISPANYLVANLKVGEIFTPQSSYVRFESLKYLRERVLENVIKENLPKNTPPRIFLARKGVIRNYNQDEVYELLVLYGFEAVYLEDLTLFEQVQLMQKAQVIIGPTGAAWTNLIFCNPDVLALCWMADEYGELTCFSDLAKFSQVKMEYLRYKAGSKNARDLYYGSYDIDVDQIKRWLVTKEISMNGVLV